MSDSIDYDELDKAVSEAIKAKNSKKSAAKTAVAKSATQKTAVKAETKTSTPVTRGYYIDFVRKNTSTHTTGAHKVTPLAPTPTNSARIHRTAKLPTVSSSMPNYQPKDRSIVSIKRADITKRAVASKSTQATTTKLAQKPVTKNTQLATQKIVKTTPTVLKPAPKPVRTSAPAGSIIKPEQILANKKHQSASTQPKHPLGEISHDNQKSIKNTYTQISPEKTEKTNRHTVTETREKSSGWIWTIIVLLIIAIGAGLGYLAYLLFFAK